MFACITAILAQIRFTLPSLVPITLQTLGIYLIGLVLKPKIAFISSLIYILMGAIGLPVYSGFSAGLSTILGPTGGYIFSFPITALIISYLVHYRSTTIFRFGALILGTIICYLIGTLWFMYIMKMSFSASLIICVLPFLPGDVLKIFIAAALTNKFKNIIKD